MKHVIVVILEGADFPASNPIPTSEKHWMMTTWGCQMFPVVGEWLPKRPAQVAYQPY